MGMKIEYIKLPFESAETAALETCSTAIENSETTCNYNGQIYHTGEGFKSTDGCNTCGCTNDFVFCTVPITSFSTAEKTCNYNGQIYHTGEGFKSTDGCNTCGCTNGFVFCTEMACAHLPLDG
ncbi:U-reduvitoxin-Pr11a-like [Haliotis cracherodii]|uniref:U-reduvitoxin-Pr11a-like n=1 Tax=Haliotis cracherodii TaxID=6455 RepID=UPI0039ED97FE